MLKLTLVTPIKKMLTEVEVEEVYIPAYKGELNILPGHSPLVTTLGAGVLKYKLRGSPTLEVAAVSWGYCEVFDNQVNVLAENAEMPQEIDVERAEEALKQATQVINTASDIQQIEDEQNRLIKAQVRLEAAKLKANA